VGFVGFISKLAGISMSHFVHLSTGLSSSGLLLYSDCVGRLSVSYVSICDMERYLGNMGVLRRAHQHRCNLSGDFKTLPWI
jgi:hypothetical protein